MDARLDDLVHNFTDLIRRYPDLVQANRAGSNMLDLARDLRGDHRYIRSLDTERANFEDTVVVAFALGEIFGVKRDMTALDLRGELLFLVTSIRAQAQ